MSWHFAACAPFAWLVTLGVCPLVLAQSEFEFELIELFGEEAFVSIATGRKQPLHLAPAVASVITSDDIAAIGATTLSERLDLVPGFHSVYRFQNDCHSSCAGSAPRGI